MLIALLSFSFSTIQAQSSGCNYYKQQVQTYSVPVSNTWDDAEEQPAGNISNANTLRMGHDDTDTYIGVRFANVNLPANAIIQKVRIQFAGGYDCNTNSDIAIIYGENDTQNSSSFSYTTYDITSRTPTAANVSWTVPFFSYMAIGEPVITPDLKPIVDEFIAEGWTSGNPMTFIMYSDLKKYFRAYNTDGGTRQAIPGQFAPMLVFEYVEPTQSCAGLSGIVYEDYNDNGYLDVSAGAICENGLANIDVNIYDDSGLIGTATTNMQGNWSFTGGTFGDSLRVEYDLPNTLEPAKASNLLSSTAVTFVQTPECCLDFGVRNKAEFTCANPQVLAVCHVKCNAPTPGIYETLISNFETDKGNSDILSDYQSTVHPIKVTYAKTGSLYGLAVNKKDNVIYAGAGWFNLSDVGSAGVGGIYCIDNSTNDGTDGSVNDTHVSTLTTVPNAGTDPGAGLTCENRNNPNTIQYAAKIGLGDLDINSDNDMLYTINLHTNELVSIPVDGCTTGAQTTYALPTPSGTHACAGDLLKPFGLKYHMGKLYVGAVCTALSTQSASNLWAYVFEYTEGSGFNAVPVLDFALDFERGGWNHYDINNEYINNDWHPWRDTWDASNPIPDSLYKVDDTALTFPQPILSDIEFDKGDMILGFMDRFGLQWDKDFDPSGHISTEISGVPAGDILRAGKNVNGTWTIENNGEVNGEHTGPLVSMGKGTSAGIGDGEFYTGERFGNAHHETTMGTLVQIPGYEHVITTAFDPTAIYSSYTDINRYGSGGFIWLDNQDGMMKYAWEGYYDQSFDFGKGNGFGDLEYLCECAPIEIGNRIWQDTDADGVQDPSEPPIPNVLVEIYNAAGTKIGETKTDEFGRYYFNDTNVILGGANGLLDDTDYFIAIADSQMDNDGNITSASNFTGKLTIENNSSTGVAEENDSDGLLPDATPSGIAVIDNNDLPYIPVTTGVLGSNQFYFEFGFIPNFTIGNYVWLDEDGDGDQDAGESGIPGVPVSLYDENSVLLETVYTDFNGGYLFENVPTGDYTITVDDTQLPAGTQNQTYDLDGVLDHSTAVTVTEDKFDIDFGYNFAPPADTNAPAGSQGAIGDRLWSDANSDGIQNQGEPGIGGVTVNLLDDNGTVIGITTTGSNGYYIFDNLNAGVYSIQVDDTTLPSGFTTTPTGDPDSDGDNTSEEIILAPGDVYLDMDFGYNSPTSYRIGDKVYIDLNANGAEDAGELPIAEVTVTLIDDANGNGVWDAGELPIANTTTDATGNYLFEGVSDGDYVVAITDTDDVISNLANSADPDGGTDEYSAVTIAGADNLTQDFGYTPAGHTSTDGIIGDFVFLDTNGDNAYTPGEPGIENVKVELYDGTNSLIATSFTDPNGMYLFGSLPADTYTVKVDPTSLPSSSYIPVGLVQSVDPDGGNDNESTTTIATGGQDLDQDFGYKSLTPNTISGTIWEDIDANGTLDESSPNYFENVTLELRDGDGNFMGITTTDSNGDFSFTGLPNGTYYLDVVDEFEVLSDYWKSTGPNPGWPNNSQEEIRFINIIGGNTDITSDFGYYTTGASLGNYVWEDLNLDGIQDATEPALQGIEVTLEITFPDGTIVTTTDVTDANGHYSFDNLLIDEDYNTGGGGAMPTYSISAAAPLNYIATTIDVNSNGNDLEDSEDPAGTLAIPTQGQKDVTANANPTLETQIASYDFGFGLSQTFNIGNFVWLDEDGDGDQDAGEVGIGGVPVYLEELSGTILETVITDFDGGYLFEDYPAGSYRVRVDDTKLPAGLTNQTFDNEGPLDHQSVVVLSIEDDLDQDFGYNYAPPADTNNPASAVGAIGDRVWSDANGDGMENPNEVGIGGVTVNLLDAAGTVIGTTTTDDSGYYIFDNLAADVYMIQVDDSTLPARFTTTPTGDPDGDNTNTSEKLPLGPGDVHMNMDFGYNDPSAYNLGDRIYLDANVSGGEDVGELPIPNVTVALIADTNGNGIWDIGELPIATDITDANGNYLFTGLGNGDYVVAVTNSNNVLSGMTNTADPDGGLNGYSGETISGADDLTQDFGYAPDGHTATDAIIGDLVFLDADRDGTYSADDSGLEGIDVLLYNSSNVFVGSTTTDVNGNYLFGGLPADTYSVEIGTASLPTGLSNNVDPDGGNDDTSTTTLAAGGQDLDQDFGYESTIPNTVSGTIWEDRDAAGDLNETSPVYFENVTVVLRDANGNVIGITITDTNGDYAFTGLPDGTYTIEITDDNNILNGHWLSDGTNDGSNNNSQENNYSVSVAGGSTNDTGDFGYFIDGASLGNFVWDDTDEDGIQDVGEVGIPGVVVTLVITYPDGTTTTVTETTDAAGHYSFENLLLDEDYNTGGGGAMPSYVVSAATPSGFQTTIIDANSNGNDGEDSEDPAGTIAIPNQGMDDPTANSTPTNEQVIAYYDFGFSQIPLPVTLTRFNAAVNDCNVALSWESELETDFSHYIVERSRNGSLTFEYVAKVQAKQGSGTKVYEYDDVYITGKAFYRLKMLNLDGTYSYSNVVSIETDCQNDITGIKLFPNPIGNSHSTLTMNFISQQESIAWITLTDMLGIEQLRFPVTIKEGENVLNTDISNLAAGTFIISIGPENGRVISKQFVKIKN